MALTKSWVYQSSGTHWLHWSFHLPLWKGQQFCLTRINALHANRLAFLYVVSTYRTITALSTIMFPNQTWVCSSVHSKANLLRPGHGEEKCSTYCRAKQRVWWDTGIRELCVLARVLLKWWIIWMRQLISWEKLGEVRGCYIHLWEMKYFLP